MFQNAYEKAVQYASEGAMADELKIARTEFEKRTGELFESDPAFERRIAAFLEWYVLDYTTSFEPKMTPAMLYIQSVADGLPTDDLNALRILNKTQLSLFEFKKVKGEHLRVVDLLNNTKHHILERRRTAGLASGDILEARMVPLGSEYIFSETLGVMPRRARSLILKATKRYRKAKENGVPPRDWVHRVVYFANRCERYAHVEPEKIFAEL